MNNIEENREIQERLPLIKWGWVRAVVFFCLLGFPTMYFVRGLKRYFIYSNENIQGAEQMFYGQFIKASLFILLIILMRKYIDRKSIESLGFKFSSVFRKDLLIGVIASIGMVGFIFSILLITGSVKVISVQFPVSEILWLLGVFVLVAFREEMVSRGYLMVNLMDSMNKYWALIITSSIFAMFHIGNDSMNVLNFINIILAGLMIGIYYIHRRNLWLPIGIHFGWNFALGPIFGSAISGNNVTSILTLELTGNELLTGGSFGFEGSIFAPIFYVLAIVIIHFKYRQSSVPEITTSQ